MDKSTKKLILIITGLFLICTTLGVLVWRQDQSNDLEVIFFDIGQGDSILIKTPSRHKILIDGGPDSGVLAKLGRELPFYDRSIDLMVLTHPHSDHVAGLVDVLRRYEVAKVLYTGVDHSSPDFVAWRDYIDDNSIEMTIASSGQVFQFGEVALEILYPFEDVSGREFDDLNDSSIVTRLTYQNNSFLFTGDAPTEVEEELINTGVSLESKVLKVGHHGSKYSSSREFLEKVQATTAVIQVAEDNNFGHPHLLTIRKLEGMGVEILRNDELGDIKFICDGVVCSF